MSKQVAVSKVEKERTKLVQEKCQAMLNDMLRDDDNKYCEDCDAKGPRWASWNLGIYLCIRCAGIHRNLGVHISKVKSVNLDTWTPEQVVSMTSMGNSRARAVYEANLPDNFRRPQTDVALENFIRAKYEHKKYIAKEWTAPPPQPKVDWSSEIDEIIRNKKKPNNNNTTTPLFNKLHTTKPNPNNTTVVTKDPPPVVAPPTSAAAPAAQVVAAVIQEDLFSSDLAGVFDSSPANDFVNELTNNSAQQQQSTSSSTQSSQQLLAGLDLSQKMTKENILSLYGQQHTTTTFQQQQQPQQQQNNPFINPINHHQQPQQQLQQLSHGLMGLNLATNPTPQPQQQQQQQQNHFAGLQMFPTNNSSPLQFPPPQNQQQQQQNNLFWK